MVKTDLFTTALELAGPPAEPPVRMGLAAGDRIAAMGDSITQGGGYLRAMNAVFRQRLGQLGLPVIINAGVSGQKAEDMVARFDRDVVRHAPTVATISVGINDVWHRLDAPHDEQVLAAYADNVTRMVQMARDAGIRVYLLAPTVIEEDRASEGNRRLADYVTAGRQIARRDDCTYVDLHELFLRAVDAAAARRGAGETVPPFTSDGVHMEPLGDVLMAVGVLRAFGVDDAGMAATDLTGVFA